MDTSITITELLRYPVKGLAGQSFRQVHVSGQRGVLGDRLAAIAHGTSTFDHEAGTWMPRRNFVVAAHSPPIVTLRAEYDESSGRVTIVDPHGGRLTLEANADPTGRPLEDMLAELDGHLQPGPYRIAVSNDAGSLTDHSVAAVSLMNVDSLSRLERETGLTLDRRRFRGNLWLSGAEPWGEMTWIGREFEIGRCRLKIIEPIVRCAAIDVNPESGKRDVQALKGLGRMQEDCCFGVLAEVVRDGTLTVGDELR